jgi:DNA-binding transcriptional ArsR family regulator
MPLVVDEDAARGASRLTAITMALFTMRCMENWKQDVSDYDGAMILIAVVAITSERLLRTELAPEERELARAITPERLARCNVSSISSATGINRETTRRKVKALIEQGLLTREEDGTINFAPGFAQRDVSLTLVRRQLDGVVRLANELTRMGVLKWM